MEAITAYMAVSDPDVAKLEGVIHQLQNVHIAKCVLVASLTLLVYDWLLTLDEEVALVWPSRWGTSKVLFFANRYLAVVDPVLLVYVMMYGSGPTACVRGFQVLGGFTAFGILVAELILAMRTWAIWERKKSVTIILVVFLTAGIAVDLFVMIRYLGGVSYVPSPSHAISGCLLQFKTRIVFWDFVLVMVTETLMLVLLVIKALQHFRHSRSTLMVCMYHDGIFYFGFILAASIANACTILTAPVELHNFLIVTQRVLHSLLCSRVLLHIRGAYSNRGLVLSNEMDQSRNPAGFAFRKPQLHTFNETEDGSALALTTNPEHIRFSAIAYGSPPPSANKEYMDMDTNGWGHGRGYADGAFQSRAFDVPSCDYIASPASPSGRSERTVSNIWP